MPAVASILPHTDYFLPSIEEALALSGLADMADAARYFLDLGVNACVFTLGEDGAYYRDRSGATFRMPAFDVAVKCTCGCGDAFNAGFAVGLVRASTPNRPFASHKRPPRSMRQALAHRRAWSRSTTR
jgi:sugar/nucleoside kinase (ribokinase family)